MPAKWYMLDLIGIFYVHARTVKYPCRPATCRIAPADYDTRIHNLAKPSGPIFGHGNSLVKLPEKPRLHQLIESTIVSAVPTTEIIMTKTLYCCSSHQSCRPKSPSYFVIGRSALKMSCSFGFVKFEGFLQCQPCYPHLTCEIR